MIESFKLTKERKIILIIGAVVLILGSAYRFYPVVHDVFSKTDEIELTGKNIEKYLEVVAQRKGLERQKNLLTRELNRMEAGFLTGDTPTLAAVEIQGIINEIAQSNSVRIMTMQVLRAKDADDLGYIMIPVRFSINSNILQLKQILYQLESPAKMLIVTDLSVDVNTRGVKGQVRATMTVAGIMKGEQKEELSQPKG